MIFIEKKSNFRKKNFVLFYFIFLLFMILLIHKPWRQSEHSGLHPDTSSLVSVLLLLGKISFNAEFAFFFGMIYLKS